MQYIACKTCSHTLTKPLKQLPEEFAAEYEDAQDVVSVGEFIVADDSFATRLSGCFVTNIDDVIAPSYHPDKSRLEGCCGYSDSEGPNLICHCGVEIGSEMSDCWVPRMTYFSATATELVDDSSQQ